MVTFIIAALIAVATFFGIRRLFKSKGACGDCECSCPIKEEMHKPAHLK